MVWRRVFVLIPEVQGFIQPAHAGYPRIAGGEVEPPPIIARRGYHQDALRTGVGNGEAFRIVLEQWVSAGIFRIIEGAISLSAETHVHDLGARLGKECQANPRGGLIHLWVHNSWKIANVTYSSYGGQGAVFAGSYHAIAIHVICGNQAMDMRAMTCICGNHEAVAGIASLGCRRDWDGLHFIYVEIDGVWEPMPTDVYRGRRSEVSARKESARILRPKVGVVGMETVIQNPHPRPSACAGPSAGKLMAPIQYWVAAP